MVAFSPNYYERQYKKLNVTEELQVSHQDLMKVTNHLIDYIEGKADNIDIQVPIDGEVEEFFNAREKAHMIDVQDLFQLSIVARNIALVICLLSLLLLILWKRLPGVLILAKTALWSVAVFLIFFAGIVIWIAADFRWFWNTFHWLGFSNDLWMLDPATDRMIVMFPLEFFWSVNIRIAAYILFSLLLLALVSFIMIKKYSHQKLDI